MQRGAFAIIPLLLTFRILLESFACVVTIMAGDGAGENFWAGAMAQVRRFGESEERATEAVKALLAQ